MINEEQEKHHARSLKCLSDIALFKLIATDIAEYCEFGDEQGELMEALMNRILDLFLDRLKEIPWMQPHFVKERCLQAPEGFDYAHFSNIFYILTTYIQDEDIDPKRRLSFWMFLRMKGLGSHKEIAKICEGLNIPDPGVKQECP